MWDFAKNKRTGEVVPCVQTKTGQLEVYDGEEGGVRRLGDEWELSAPDGFPWVALAGCAALLTLGFYGLGQMWLHFN